MRTRMVGVLVIAVALALAFAKPMEAKSPYAPPAERAAAMAMEAAGR